MESFKCHEGATNTCEMVPGVHCCMQLLPLLLKATMVRSIMTCSAAYRFGGASRVWLQLPWRRQASCTAADMWTHSRGLFSCPC